MARMSRRSRRARAATGCVLQEMLFKKPVHHAECDQAPCGTGMKYLDPSYHRVAGIVHHAEFGTPQGDDMGTNMVFGVHSVFNRPAAKPHSFH